MPPPDIVVSRADAALLRRALLTSGATSAEPDAFAAAPGALAFVATAPETAPALAGQILGWCWGHLMPRPDGTTMAYLHHLEVADAHRRHGVGRALTSAFLEAATEAGAVSTFLITGQANTAARHLYESLGAFPALQGPTVNYWWRLPR